MSSSSPLEAKPDTRLADSTLAASLYDVDRKTAPPPPFADVYAPSAVSVDAAAAAAAAVASSTPMPTAGTNAPAVATAGTPNHLYGYNAQLAPYSFLPFHGVPYVGVAQNFGYGQQASSSPESECRPRLLGSHLSHLVFRLRCTA